MQFHTPSTLLPILLTFALTTLTLASSSPSPDLSQNISSPELEDRQLAAGGGVAPTTLAPSQYPISTTAGSLFTVNGVTSATWKLFVQTFATTALGTWELGPTPAVGSIGLGDIQGTVGGVRKEGRDLGAMETPAPVV
ncbi:hypothetical protein BKA64DRAFT_466304 [Cadophora sp. MPI-SDFR-AT-0126]|nr:hypothetical protein BKA64DRAFT_466304 [Leotiomycetes sp. MPI-SDFR-AT-0126]